MNRTLVKSNLKRNILNNWKSVASATLIAPIAMFLSTFMVNRTTEYDFANGVNLSASYDNLGMVSTILSAVAITIAFLGIELARNKKQFHQLSTSDNFTWLNDGKDWIDLILLNLLVGLFTFLWALLFIIPGIIKSYGYSQASFIFFENKRNGTPITYREAIKRSDIMMKGNKMDLFILKLSFIGYQLLVGILAFVGLAMLMTIVFTPLAIIAFLGSFAIGWFVSVYQLFTEAEFYLYVSN